MSGQPQDGARKRRNVAIGLGLFLLVALIFLITLVQLRAGILDRPL